MPILYERARLIPEKVDTLATLPVHISSATCSEVYMSEDKKFYVYVHRYASGPKEGQVFYVGKGSGVRSSSSYNRSVYWNRIVEKYEFTSQILVRVSSEKCAFSLEKAFIRMYGRENLCNLTDGGDGVPSMVPHWRIKVFSSLGETFDSMSCAAIFLRTVGYSKAQSSAISVVCDNKNRFAYGRAWSRFGFPEHPLTTSQSDVAADNFRNKLSMEVVSDEYGYFKSIMDAVRFLKSNGYPKARSGNISSVCKGKRNFAYGSNWSYK